MSFLKNLYRRIRALFIKPKTGVFVMNVDTAMEFYQRCADRKAVTEKERSKILAELAKEGKMERAYQTGRSKDQVIKDLSREHKVLRVEKKKDK